METHDNTQATTIYPKLDHQPLAPVQLTAHQQKIEDELQAAKKWEQKGEWKMAMDVYTDLAQFGFQNQGSMSKDRLSQIIARAEAIKIRLEPEDLLLNIPEGTRIIRDNTAEEVAVAFTLKQVSKFVVFNASNLVKFYVRDCYILKKPIGENRFVYSVKNNATNQNHTIELDGSKVGAEYIRTFDEIIEKQAIEFRTSESSDLTQLPTQVVKPEPPVRPEQPKPTINRYPLPTENLQDNSQNLQNNTKAETTTADKISNGIVTGSKYFGQAIDALSSKTKSSYKAYSENYVATHQPNEKPTEISNTTKTVLSASKTTAHHAAEVTSTVAGWIGSAVKGVASRIADKIPESEGKDGKESTTGKVIKVGGASIVAIGNVWNNLEKNSRDVGRSVREDTVKIVHHKHGEEAAAATDDAARTVIDTTRTVFYINDMGIKAIAKNTAKKAGQKIASRQEQKRINNQAQNQITYN